MPQFENCDKKYGRMFTQKTTTRRFHHLSFILFEKAQAYIHSKLGVKWEIFI